MVHKALMAFSLGLNLAQADLDSSTFLVSTAVFTLASPLGIGVGILMSDLPPSTTGDIFNGVLQGTAHSAQSAHSSKKLDPVFPLQVLPGEPSSTSHFSRCSLTS